MLYQLNYEANEWQVPSFPPHLTSWLILYQLNYEANELQVPSFPPHLTSWSMLYQLNYEANEHLCPGLNAVTNFANFTIFCVRFKFNKFCDFSLNSTRYIKICYLNDFPVCNKKCAEIYNFMLIDQQAPACRFYKIYDFSLTSRFFNEPLRNL